jgi:hypothetical protein
MDLSAAGIATSYGLTAEVLAAMPLPRRYRMTLSEFLRTSFAGRPPSRYTIKQAIERGEYAGEKIGSSYFIFVDENCEPLRPAITSTPAPTGNALADQLLNEWTSERK